MENEKTSHKECLDDNSKRAKKLIELSKEVSEELKENFHPHTTVVITSDYIKVEEAMLYVPIHDDKDTDF